MHNLIFAMHILIGIWQFKASRVFYMYCKNYEMFICKVSKQIDDYSGLFSLQSLRYSLNYSFLYFVHTMSVLTLASQDPICLYALSPI